MIKNDIVIFCILADVLRQTQFLYNITSIMQRFILFTFYILLTCFFAISQNGINYQCTATDVNGDELTNAVAINNKLIFQ
jgi:hypothetical protein